MSTSKTLDKIGARIVQLTKDRLNSIGLGDSELIKNISYEVDEFDDEYELIITTPSYSVNVDKGRRKGAKMPPAKPIEEWMQKKGIPKEASFPIRRSISINGIKPRPFLDVITNEVANVEDVLFDAAQEDIVDELEKIFKKIQ